MHHPTTIVTIARERAGSYRREAEDARRVPGSGANARRSIAQAFRTAAARLEPASYPAPEGSRP